MKRVLVIAGVALAASVSVTGAGVKINMSDMYPKCPPHTLERRQTKADRKRNRHTRWS